MPYALFECADNGSSGEMDKIWDRVWSDSKISDKLLQIEDDELLPLFIKYLPLKGKILEAGCGLGQWVIYLRDREYDITGIDFAEQTVRTTKKYNNALPIEFGDVRMTRFENNYFDAYISLGVVEHFREGPGQALSEARRILKKDGLLFISVPVFNSVRKYAVCFEKLYDFMKTNRFIRKMLGKKKEYPEKHFIEYRFSIEEFETILNKSSFPIAHKFALGHSTLSMFNYFLEPPTILLKGTFFYNICEYISRVLKKMSEWIAPHSVLWICSNDKKE